MKIFPNSSLNRRRLNVEGDHLKSGKDSPAGAFAHCNRGLPIQSGLLRGTHRLEHICDGKWQAGEGFTGYAGLRFRHQQAYIDAIRGVQVPVRSSTESRSGWWPGERGWF